eukprot:5312660-Amphidinium_carterae.4
MQWTASVRVTRVQILHIVCRASGLDAMKKAFADAQELGLNLGAGTSDLLWTEVKNRIDRVMSYTKKVPEE